MEERLQKILSAAGVCSRRAAEGYITAGRVTVNGETADLGRRADPETDEICLDGKPIAQKEEHVYLLLNKPRGYVTTLSDEKGRKTVADLVAGCGKRVYPVGRLDLDSEGLLLMTNDGDLMQRLLHPSHEVTKTYVVSVYGEVRGAAQRLGCVTDLEGRFVPLRWKSFGRREILRTSMLPFMREKTARSGGCAPSAALRSSGCAVCVSIRWNWGICLQEHGGILQNRSFLR